MLRGSCGSMLVYRIRAKKWMCWGINYCGLGHPSQRIRGKRRVPAPTQSSVQKSMGRLQEADESELWFELLRDDCAIRGKQLEQLLSETSELIGIFVTMVERTKRNLK